MLYIDLLHELNPRPTAIGPEEWLKRVIILFRAASDDYDYRRHFSVEEMVRYLSPRVDITKIELLARDSYEFSCAYSWWHRLSEFDRDLFLERYESAIKH